MRKSAVISACLLLYITLFWALSALAKPPFPDMKDWVKTDFSMMKVELDDMIEGGPGKDGIRSIDEPIFVSIDAAANWLSERDPVVVFAVGGESKAYPLQILMYHEIVNDQLAGQAISVTYCPLCNAAMVFSRQHKGELLDFGTTGKVYSSNLVMYDRQSESWWLQFTGEAVVGKHAGDSLTLLPSQIVSFEQYRDEFPLGEVLSNDTGFSKKYGINPYPHYDSRALPIGWFYRKPFDDRLPAMERVLGVVSEESATAFPFSYLKTKPLLQTNVGDLNVLIISKSGMASSVDERKISQSKDTLAAVAFSRVVNGKLLDFELKRNVITDSQTQSIWNMFGVAVEGELKGARLEKLDRGVYFSFVWLEFYPNSLIFNGR